MQLYLRGAFQEDPCEGLVTLFQNPSLCVCYSNRVHFQRFIPLFLAAFPLSLPLSSPLTFFAQFIRVLQCFLLLLTVLPMAIEASMGTRAMNPVGKCWEKESRLHGGCWQVHLPPIPCKNAVSAPQNVFWGSLSSCPGAVRCSPAPSQGDQVSLEQLLLGLCTLSCWQKEEFTDLFYLFTVGLFFSPL